MSAYSTAIRPTPVRAAPRSRPRFALPAASPPPSARSPATRRWPTAPMSISARRRARPQPPTSVCSRLRRA
ncbi:hypothetical protein RM53_11175, partial [Brevundimonas nasdae]